MKRLREGYTTGTCAAAAAKAATLMLTSGKIPQEVTIDTPAGITLTLTVVDPQLGQGYTSACVIKDAGDDPDVTNGMKIYATVSQTSEGITIKGGEGVGIVTKPGLSVPVGAAAINPVPLQMITAAVAETLSSTNYRYGVEVGISAPEGEERAKKTFNSRLGIIGGISILGTTGIVKPMSVEAWKDALVLQIDIAKAAGFTTIALVPGQKSERVATTKLHIPHEAVIQMSDFVGFMLDACIGKGIEGVLLVGHASKLVKVAKGFFDTHSKVAKASPEMVATYLAGRETSPEFVQQLVGANTVEETISLLGSHRLLKVFDEIATDVSLKARERVQHKISVGAVLLNLAGEVVGRDETAVKIGRKQGWSL